MITLCECEVEYRPRWKRIAEGVSIAVISILAAIGGVVVLGGAAIWFLTP